MPDTLTTVTTLIQSPPGQLVAGGVLAGVVWKFFERVESVLNENTKLEIALWLLGRKKVGPAIQGWPNTFAKVFDRVFGTKHLSWKCFVRSLVSSLVIGIAAWGLTFQFMVPTLWGRGFWGDAGFSVVAAFWCLVVVVLANGIPDYVSLLTTRLVLGLAKRTASGLLLAALLLLDLSATVAIASLPASGGYHFLFDGVFAVLEFKSKALSDEIFQNRVSGLQDSDFGDELKVHMVRFLIAKRSGNVSEAAMESRQIRRIGIRPLLFMFVLPAFFTSIWLWLYAGSGFLLKAARRFDLGFEWFNRHMDIEKKPLQSLGLVAGVLVAVVYWVAVVVSRVLA